ncbi:MAG: protein-L-isoaspartate(D-aspartate) O-methyltransferase [Flavobacteriales bacterium]|jgi:protein-L-isoaspartate(D-aspartate) O-methyltransferase
MIEDTYRHKGLRNNLVKEIAALGVTDQKVLEALRKVPRHAFLPSAFLQYAYVNKAVNIGAGQTISHPYTVALQSQLLRIEPGMKVLEVGTGSGYQTSILCELGAKVYSIERKRVLLVGANQILADQGYTAKLTFGDGFKGWPAYAPFDRIIITCAAPRLPEELMIQLRPGGRIVVPYGEGSVQEMMTIDETESGEFVSEIHGTFTFVPMLEKRSSIG